MARELVNGGLITNLVNGDMAFGPPTWSPLDLTNLTAWWDPTYGLYQDTAKTTPATSDGHPVGAWVDRTDTYEWLQGTTGAKPTLKLNIKNGMPTIRVDGGDSMGTTLNRTQPNTRYHVIGNGGNNVIFDGLAARQQLYISSGTAGYMYAGSFLNFTVSDTSDWAIVQSLFNGSSSKFRWNATETTGDPGTSGNTTSTLFDYGGGGFNWTAGDHGDLIMVSAAISNDERDLLEAWLSARWAISL